MNTKTSEDDERMPPVPLKPYPKNGREPTPDDLRELIAHAEQFPGTLPLVAETRR